MELKDFIKGVIGEIVSAIEESQQELGGKVCISPVMGIGFGLSPEKYVKSFNGWSPVSNIDFDVAVTIGSSESSNNSINGGIKIFEVFKAGTEAREGAQKVSQNVSRVKFHIPVVYPSSIPDS